MQIDRCCKCSYFTGVRCTHLGISLDDIGGEAVRLPSSGKLYCDGNLAKLESALVGDDVIVLERTTVLPGWYAFIMFFDTLYSWGSAEQLEYSFVDFQLSGHGTTWIKGAHRRLCISNEGMVSQLHEAEVALMAMASCNMHGVENTNLANAPTYVKDNVRRLHNEFYEHIKTHSAVSYYRRALAKIWDCKLTEKQLVRIFDMQTSEFLISYSLYKEGFSWEDILELV